MKEKKVVEDVAEKEFLEWCKRNDIDCDVSTMNEKDSEEFESLKKRIVKAICNGRAVIDGRNIKYTFSEFTEVPENQKEVTIAPPNGYAYTAMDGYKQDRSFKRLNAVMSQMTGLADGIFLKMDNIDLKVFHAVTTLFLAD